MEKKTITFSANEQKLIKTGGMDCYASNTVAYIEAHFDLGENWDGYDSVRAVWWNDYNKTVATVLDSDGTCVVPYEVLTRKSAVKVNLVGSIAENDVLTDRLTTCPVVALTIKCNAKITGTETAEVTPSQFEQFASNVRADASSARASATEAAASASASAQSASDAAQSAAAALNFNRGAMINAEQAHDSAMAASLSQQEAETAEGNARASEQNASASASEASQSAQSASASAEQASESAGQASASAQSASTDADRAETARTFLENVSAEATTLAAGSQATASYDDGVFSFGIPQGAKGDTGATGAKGDAFEYSDFTPAQLEALTGPQGPQGERGEKGDTGEVSQAQLDAAVSQLKSDFDDTLNIQIVAENKAVTASLATAGAYFLDTGKYVNTVGTQFIVTQYPVEKGLSYNLKGTVSLQVTAGLIAFDEDGTLENNQILTTVLKTCGNTAENVNVDYTATENGYLYVASVTGRGTLTVTQTTKYDSKRIIDLEDFDALISGNVDAVQYPLDYDTVTQLYIASNGTFAYASDGTRFSVYYFPVEEGKKYRVVYNDHSMLAAYGAVSFSTSIPASSGSSTVLLLASTTDTDIDFDYTATTDGYLCVDKANSSTSFAFYEYGTEIQHSSRKKALKIQLFGDSITDDYWGDQRTWATVLPNYMPEYDLTVINSAVGGSAIGYHGHSNGGRYAEKTYNYVADLLTDGTLETDSDVIVVLIGTNNWSGSYPPLGVFGDKASVDPDTGTGTGFSKFYGCIEFVINYISTNTDALLIIVTPPQRYNTADEERSVDSYGAPINNNNNTLRQLCDAFKVSCEFYGIPCLDLNSELGWNRINVHTYCDDGLHPNNKGDDLIAQLISSEIKRHLH